MKWQYALALAVQMSFGVPVSGCTASEGESQEIGVAEEQLVTANALTVNALTVNALTTNALTAKALTTEALTTDALKTNALVQDALRDPLTREFFSYVVSCALPAGAHIAVAIDDVTYGFDGEIGLFAQWGDPAGTCDKRCESWVSGCVLSRVNYLGVKVPISIRGHNEQLATDRAEYWDYARREATYYGNVFSQPQIRYACLSPGEKSDERVCGPSITNCVMKVLGTCDRLCEKADRSGAFPDCRSMPRDPLTGTWPLKSTSYLGSVTVFLSK